MKKYVCFFVSFFIPVVVAIIICFCNRNEIRFDFSENAKNDGLSYQREKSIVKNSNVEASLERETEVEIRENAGHTDTISMVYLNSEISTDKFSIRLSQYDKALMIEGWGITFKSPREMHIGFPAAHSLGKGSGVLYLYSDKKEKMVARYCN